MSDPPGVANTRRVLVAGATGYLGRFVAREFKARGHFVRALARSPQKLDDIKHELDEVVYGEITNFDSLEDVCEHMDVVFSSVGITRQKDNLTWKDVDYQGNKNLLEVARRAGVKKFIYVSVLDGPNLRHLDIVRAHEDFVDLLAASGMDYTVIRPTGYYSDMTEFWVMAKRGRVYLVGRGDNRINPIHGADLAVTCVDALDDDRRDVDVGGPDVFTYREIALLAFRIQGKPVRVASVPVSLSKLIIAVARIFNRHQGELLAFLTTEMSRDAVAPPTGTHKLDAYFHELLSREEQV